MTSAEPISVPYLCLGVSDGESAHCIRLPDEAGREHSAKRAEMLEWLTKAHLAKLEGWCLVEERSADGLRTTWHFEQRTPPAPGDEGEKVEMVLE